MPWKSPDVRSAPSSLQVAGGVGGVGGIGGSSVIVATETALGNEPESSSTSIFTTKYLTFGSPVAQSRAERHG